MTSTPAAIAASRRPNARFLLSHPAHLIALGFGSGLSPWAPGTAGSLWAWGVFALLEHGLNAAQLQATMPVLIVAGSLIGWWACTVTARNMNVADPSAVVWDEVIGLWLVLWLLSPASLGMQAVAFALFRLFDAVKRGPVGWADAAFKARPGATIGWAQGFGILFDDLVAASCALLVIAVWKAL